MERSSYLPVFIETLIKGRRKDIVAIVVTTERILPAKSLRRSATEGLHLYGFRGFPIQSFRYLRFEVLGRLRHILPLRAFHSIKAVAEHYSIPFYSCQNINEPHFIESLSRELNPDVIVSIESTQIFKRGILNLPRLGCINVHPSLLPRYRGPAPRFWVLANGEAETGVTVHYMDEKLDNGGIILQSKVAIRPEDTVHSLIARTRSLGATLVLQALEHIERGTVSITPNDSEDATYYSFPTAEDVKMLLRRGRKFR